MVPLFQCPQDYTFNIVQKTKPHVRGEITPQPEHSKRFTALYIEKNRKELERGDQEEKRNSERIIKPIIKSLSENGY